MKSILNRHILSSWDDISLYLIAITLVATIGGFLFGFDTAVVNGAEKSLVDFYIIKALEEIIWLTPFLISIIRYKNN